MFGYIYDVDKFLVMPAVHHSVMFPTDHEKIAQQNHNQCFSCVLYQKIVHLYLKSSPHHHPINLSRICKGIVPRFKFHARSAPLLFDSSGILDKFMGIEIKGRPSGPMNLCERGLVPDTKCMVALHHFNIMEERMAFRFMSSFGHIKVCGRGAQWA